MARASGYSGSSKSTTSEGYADLRGRVPEWAEAVPEPQRIWLADATIEPHPRWPGVTCVLTRSPAAAAMVCAEWLEPCIAAARAAYPGTNRVMVKPMRLGQGESDAYWARRSAMPSTQPDGDKERVRVMLHQVGIGVGDTPLEGPSA